MCLCNRTVKEKRRLPEPGELPRAGEIHLWRMDLDELAARGGPAASALAEAEQERAGRFIREEHRRRFAAGRGWLRSVLGACLNRPPLDVPLMAGSHGKPRIAAEANPVRLQFNLSHCGRFALLAVTVGREIGVDLEDPRRNTDWAAVAARFCTAREREHVATLAPGMRPVAFAEIWARKEAAAKALGEGLASPVFSVNVGPADWGTVDCGDGLVVWSLPPQNGLVAAMAVWPAPEVKEQQKGN